eukprot:gene44698-55620_t
MVSESSQSEGSVQTPPDETAEDQQDARAAQTHPRNADDMSTISALTDEGVWPDFLLHGFDLFDNNDSTNRVTSGTQHGSNTAAPEVQHGGGNGSRADGAEPPVNRLNTVAFQLEEEQREELIANMERINNAMDKAQRAEFTKLKQRAQLSEEMQKLFIDQHCAPRLKAASGNEETLAGCSIWDIMESRPDLYEAIMEDMYKNYLKWDRFFNWVCRDILGDLRRYASSIQYLVDHIW